MKSRSQSYLAIILLLAVAVVAMVTVLVNMNEPDGNMNDNQRLAVVQDSAKINAGGVPDVNVRFDPNPVVEGFILINHRSGDLKLTSESPAMDTTFHLQDSILKIPFSGRIKSSEGLPNSIRLKIYSNSRKSFENKAFMINKVIEVEDKGIEGAFFETEIEQAWEPGLFYFIYENINNGEMLMAGKFKLK